MGKGVACDPATSKKYMLMAAENGDAQAMFNVAVSSRNEAHGFHQDMTTGQCMPMVNHSNSQTGPNRPSQDMVQAELWMYEASMRGHARAVQDVKTWDKEKLKVVRLFRGESTRSFAEDREATEIHDL